MASCLSTQYRFARSKSLAQAPEQTLCVKQTLGVRSMRSSGLRLGFHRSKFARRWVVLQSTQSAEKNSPVIGSSGDDAFPVMRYSLACPRTQNRWAASDPNVVAASATVGAVFWARCVAIGLNPMELLCRSPQTLSIDPI